MSRVNPNHTGDPASMTLSHDRTVITDGITEAQHDATCEVQKF